MHVIQLGMNRQTVVTRRGLLTCQETDPPQAAVQRHVHLGGLVDGQDDALLQVEPVVGADGDPQQAQGAHSKHAAQQRQRLPATKAHTTASTAGGAAGGMTNCE